MKNMFYRAKWLFLSFWVLSVVESSAQSLTNMAGLWNGIDFQVPMQIAVVNSAITGTTAFGLNQFQATFQSDGTFIGTGGSGFFSIGSQGVVTIAPTGGQPISGRVNAPQDVFVGISTDNQNQQLHLNLAARAPATLNNNDLTGTWNMAAFDTPQQLIEVTSGSNSVVTDLLGINSNSVSAAPFARTGYGTITFNSDGSLSGMMQDAFTGTYTLDGNGQATLSIDTGSGILSVTGFINASKDTIFGMDLQNDGNRQEVVVLVKPPASETLAGQQGAWKITSFNVPDQLFLTSDSSNGVTAIDSTGGFDVNQAAYTAGDDGFFTGNFGDGPATGSISVGVNGAATITVNTGSGPQSHDAFVNAGMNVAANVESDGENSSISVVVKAPDVPGTFQDFGMLTIGNQIYWAAGTNRVLQAVSSLDNSWTNVPGTQDQHQFQMVTTNGSGFYRIAQQ